MLIFLSLLIISPESGPFRTKIKTLEDDIQAYELLDKTPKVGEKIVAKNKREDFKEPQQIENSTYEMKKIKTIANIKELLKSKEKIFWNNGYLVIYEE